MTKSELVKQAIHFQSPERVPVWFVNCDQEQGDVMVYHLSLDKLDAEGNSTGDNEWGYHLESLDDGTMGHPIAPHLPDWDSYQHFVPPSVDETRRMERLDSFLQVAQDRYLLASLDLSGFTVYTLLRGFENSMVDFLAEPEKFNALFTQIIEFEKEMMTLVAKRGFHGIHFADDWGTQTGLMVSPQLWRSLFKPRYREQIEHAHRLGLDVWFHSCGNFITIVDDFHEIGVDVLNIAQPNVVDTQTVGENLLGKQAFLIPISYQTVSISGTTQEIYDEAARLHKQLAAPNGGFIGYVEEYSCMGMSETNYHACAEAFRRL